MRNIGPFSPAKAGTAQRIACILLHAAVWTGLLWLVAIPGSSWAGWHELQRLQFAIAYGGLAIVFYYHNYNLLPRLAGSGRMINYGLLTVLLILFFEGVHWMLKFDLSRRIYPSDVNDGYLIEPGYYDYWLENDVFFWLVILAWGWLRYWYYHKVRPEKPLRSYPLIWTLHLFCWLFLFTGHWESYGLLDYNLIEAAGILMAAVVFYGNLLLIDQVKNRGLTFYLPALTVLIAFFWPLDAWLSFLNANRGWDGSLSQIEQRYGDVFFSLWELRFWPALILSWGYAFLVRNVAEKTITVRAEAADRQAELQALKAQLQPHFMLNVLNGLYAEALEEDSPRTAAGIVKLSRLLQHVIYESKQGRIPVSKTNWQELQHLLNRLGW